MYNTLVGYHVEQPLKPTNLLHAIIRLSVFRTIVSWFNGCCLDEKKQTFTIPPLPATGSWNVFALATTFYDIWLIERELLIVCIDWKEREKKNLNSLIGFDGWSDVIRGWPKSSHSSINVCVCVCVRTNFFQSGLLCDAIKFEFIWAA